MTDIFGSHAQTSARDPYSPSSKTSERTSVYDIELGGVENKMPPIIPTYELKNWNQGVPEAI